MGDASNVKSQGCSVVIRCYNEERHIGKLLAGLVAQSVRNTEIIVVDSGSTDATLSIAGRFPVKIVRMQPEEFSFGHSLNLGCSHASYEFIVIASAHVYPLYTDWLERLLAPFADPEVALVYGKQRGAADAWYSEQQIYKKWFPEESLADQGHPFCNNANAAIRRSLWEEHHYNRDLTGLEDLEWAKRFFEAGKKIAYCAEAEIVHVHEEKAAQIYNRYRREAIAFKRIYPDRSFSPSDFLLLFVGNALSDCCHAWHEGSFFRKIAGVILFRWMQFFGTYRGYRQRGFVPPELASRFYYPNRLSKSKGPLRNEKQRLISYD
ncbi:glycosyltransferase [Citrifermentans bremense]|uniref:glycosyltransferase n=1 Tax=Citrifermentans bremense TaxID=60035 RepID=UPI0004232F40|nr:glycosyltransferase family A protein [Citrifermentans bremense]